MDSYEINEPRRIGRVVREVRRRQGLTQADLAAQAGVSRGWLIKFEQGHAAAELATAIRVISALGLVMMLAPREPTDEDAMLMAAFDRIISGDD